MFAFKKKYFFIIESIKDLNLENIKKNKKFIVIYRNSKKNENLKSLKEFKNKFSLKSIKLFIANDINLAVAIRADGIYISSWNKSFKSCHLVKSGYDIIGSAHNCREITLKLKQGCEYILLSKLFLVDYDKKHSFLGVIKFNNFTRFSKKIVPLGGIKITNLNKLKLLNSSGLALLTEIKKKPAKIFSRLF